MSSVIDLDSIVFDLYLFVFIDLSYELRDWIPHNKNNNLINSA